MIDSTRVLQRLELVTEYLRHLRTVAAFRRETFLADPLAIGAAESYLRKSLEAIFDVGRHILAKTGHVDMAEEYKSIARGLVRYSVVSQANEQPLLQMAGYRNRMIHFYHEITAEELYDILQSGIPDIERLVQELGAFVQRLQALQSRGE
ncbi:DUF86 domain-containing protein [Carboxydochorda subterranea]|uniref:DUF86 domain-containing protein n=1 Tax=Carboxydichorda subterranea TaxID=3109565 RepID=A0ABZ1BTR6_9FIRM|nr:DUF86 domain-containing protein [Limnochorda sp. L945t]WRP16020.1 DUF86 domain-containing protein [Limnochorda sp. L945t]